MQIPRDTLRWRMFSTQTLSVASGHDFMTRIAEDWRRYLDNQLYVAAILMDVSKAFDCLSHYS